MNDYQFKLVKTQGEFTCYHYSDTDKTFIVLEGSMCSESEDRIAYLSKREMFVVRRGWEHKPFAKEERKVLLVEQRGVVNTGESSGVLTAVNDAWI